MVVLTIMDKLKQKCNERGQHVYADKIAADHIKLIAFPRNSIVNALSYDIKNTSDLDLAISILCQDKYGLTKAEIIDAVLQTNI